MRSFSLVHLTALSLPPPALTRAAADAGYQSVGLSAMPQSAMPHVCDARAERPMTL